MSAIKATVKKKAGKNKAAKAVVVPSETASAAMPTVGGLRAPKPPALAERVLANGVRVVAVRKPGVPRVEATMRVVVSRRGDAGNPGQQRLLSATLLSGTAARSSLGIAEHLQSLGATLNAGTDAEELYLSFGTLSGNLAATLDLVAEVVKDATFPEDEVALHRQRTAQELAIFRSQPQTIALEALYRRVYGDHPYARVLPDAEEVGALTRKDLKAFFTKRIVPGGTTLVLVGDVAPAKALDLAEKALGDWKRPGKATALAKPEPFQPGPTLLIDRPGSVQTNIRIATTAVDRRHADYPALAVANVIFGGYFSSRLVDNLRERNGYTYSPNSSITSNFSASHLTIGAEVATEVTVPALVETRYELGRMVSKVVDADELQGAKRYIQGTLALAIQTQAGLANYLSNLLAFGLGADFLREYPAAVEKVTVEDVMAMSAAYLAPSRAVTVLVGDASQIAESVGLLDVVEMAEAEG